MPMTALSPFKHRVIAHRGACGFAPENTLSAFVKAAQLGISWVEFDVMLSADGEVIVFHDETLDRTTNGRGDVGIHSYAYLATLDAGGWFNSAFSGERIPTLAQVLHFLRSVHLSANIEIKPLPGQDLETVLRVVEEVSRVTTIDSANILFSSFSTEALRLLRAESKLAKIGFLMHDWQPEWPTTAKELNCISMNVNEEILTAPRVSEIKQAGYLLTSYTVNSAERAAQLFDMGVDAVFSDYPNRISALG